MNYHRIFALGVLLAATSAHATPSDANDNPRFLSRIEIPLYRNCNSDVSNDGHLLFTVCDSKPEKDGMTPSDQATLYIHDISDLRNPRPVSETKIGKVEGFRLVVRNQTAFYEELSNQGILLIDVSDPNNPKPAGHIETGYNLAFRISDDGNLAVLKTPLAEYKYIDTSNAYSPKEITDPNYSSDELVTAPGQWTGYDSGKIEGLDGNVTIHDNRDHKILISPSQKSALMQLYDLSAPMNPKLLAEFPEEGSTYETHLVPKTEAIVFGRGMGKEKYGLELNLATGATFDVQRLLPALSANMVVVILRRKRASLMFSPSALRMSSNAGDIGAVFLDIAVPRQWFLL